MSKSPTEIVQMINAGVTAAMNEAGAAVGCADLAWCLDASWSTLILSGSAVGMYSDASVPDVLKAWGRLLRLDPVTSPTVKGTRQMRTQGPGVTVTVSGVVDTPAYLADGEAWLAQAPEVAAIDAGQFAQAGEDAAAFALTDTGLYTPDGYPAEETADGGTDASTSGVDASGGAEFDEQ